MASDPSSLACEQLDSESGFDLESRVIPLDDDDARINGTGRNARLVVWNVSKATIRFLASSSRRLSPPQQASACSSPHCG